MAEQSVQALSGLLDQLEESAHEGGVTVDEVVKKLGQRSFAALMLIFSLISASPASTIPGITATVAAILFILAGQMILGRKCVWLPEFITRRRISQQKLCKGIGWLRRPVRFVERRARVRLTFLLHRPWLYLPLVLILALTVFMPFMEAVPTSGSIASAVIALFAAGLLMRDGVFVMMSSVVLGALPAVVWHVHFSG